MTLLVVLICLQAVFLKAFCQALPIGQCGNANGYNANISPSTFENVPNNFLLGNLANSGLSFVSENGCSNNILASQPSFTNLAQSNFIGNTECLNNLGNFNFNPLSGFNNGVFTPVISDLMPNLQLGDVNVNGDLPIGGTIRVCGCIPVYGMVTVDGNLPSSGTAVVNTGCTSSSFASQVSEPGCLCANKIL